MNIKNEVENIKGSYKIKSPYHKNKWLPFVVIGYSLDDEYPVEVYTVEYRGWDKLEIHSNYTLESVKQILNFNK